MKRGNAKPCLVCTVLCQEKRHVELRDEQIPLATDIVIFDFQHILNVVMLRIFR